VNRLNTDLVNAALRGAAHEARDDRANRAYAPVHDGERDGGDAQAAGKPLTPAQAEAVRALAVEATNALLAAEGRYGPETWALQKLLDETATKERFFAAAFAVMTAEQRDVLTPPVARGRLQADLFSAGLMWAAHAQAVPVTDREHAVTLVTATVADLMGWGEEKKPALREIVAPWVAELPPSVVTSPGTRSPPSGWCRSRSSWTRRPASSRSSTAWPGGCGSTTRGWRPSARSTGSSCRSASPPSRPAPNRPNRGTSARAAVVRTMA
jgi:hypothetical protein